MRKPGAGRGNCLTLEGRGGLEGHHGAGRNGDYLVGLGVATGAGRTLLGFKGTETDKLHHLRGNSLGDGGESGVQSLCCALLGCVRTEFLLDGVNKLGFVHNS